MLTRCHNAVVPLLLLIGFQASIVNGQTELQLTADELTVLKATETAVQLGQQFRDSIWPGYNLDQIPLIVYIPEQWALLVNAPPHVDGFVDCPGGWPTVSTHVLYHPDQYGELAGQLAFDLPIGSTAVAGVAFTGQSERRFLEYIIHENFHQFQHARFGEIPWGREELYPIEDAGNTSLACLEILLLRDAVESLKRAEPDSARNRILQFIAVRSHRWQKADPQVKQYEQGQEINEGTAKYVEMRAISLVPKVRPASSPGGASHLTAADLGPGNMSDCISDGLNRLVATGTIGLEDMPRNRIYPVGAAQGFLLDQFVDDWKATAQQAGPDFTFVGLLQGALGLDSSRFTSLVKAAKRIYDFETIYRNSNESIAAYRAGFDSAMTTFESQAGVRVELSFNGKNLMRSRSSSSKKWLVDGGSKELRNHYEIYVLRSLSVEDLPPELRDADLPGLVGQKFRFQLKDAGLLELTDWTTKAKELVFYCLKVTSLAVDGMPQGATADAEYEFQKLQLNGTNFELQTGRPGSVSISGHSLTVRITP